MKIKAGKGEILFGIFNAVLLTFLMLITLYPMLHVLFASLSNSAALMAHSGVILSPIEFSISSYGMVFKNPMIVRGYLNTIFIVLAGVFVNILMTSLGAYFLSRKNVLWQTPITLLIILQCFSMVVWCRLSYGKKIWACTIHILLLFCPQLLNLQYDCNENRVLIHTRKPGESAKIDGANHITILWA
jgi:putative aldouronate transport system permease protein